MNGDDPTDLAGWLDESALSAGGANGSAAASSALPDLTKTGLGGTRRRSDAVSHSALARSVDTLKAQVDAEPSNWQLRRQLAEALLDAGEREAGLTVLETAMVGLERSQDLEGARSVADEIIRLIPNSVRHHQKRVEYAFRTSDRSRLPQAYLELADALFRSGQADKARAVYKRVLELSPDDPRAQAALSTFGDDFIEPLDVDDPDLLEPPELEPERGLDAIPSPSRPSAHGASGTAKAARPGAPPPIVPMAPRSWRVAHTGRSCRRARAARFPERPPGWASEASRATFGWKIECTCRKARTEAGRQGRDPSPCARGRSSSGAGFEGCWQARDPPESFWRRGPSTAGQGSCGSAAGRRSADRSFRPRRQAGGGRGPRLCQPRRLAAG